MAAVTRAPFFHVAANEASAVAEVRRLARAAAIDAGICEIDAERAAIVATEATTNAIKHADGGDLIVRTVEDGGGPAVDVIAVDRGPGMANVAECLRDGYSSRGTRGTGLGAICRQSTLFDVFSRPGQGTVVLARVASARASRSSTPPASSVVIDGMALTMRGESVCGDAWTSVARGGAAAVLVADGLGHGEAAAQAAEEAVVAFHQHSSVAPLDVLDRVHRALTTTRGAAVATAYIDVSAREVRYAGIGNIAATIEHAADGPKHLVSIHGTAGHQVRRLQEFSYPWQDGAVLVMHSDGVSPHWSLPKYPGLAARHPVVIAAVLLRDYSRGRDDATVVVAKSVR